MDKRAVTREIILLSKDMPFFSGFLDPMVEHILSGSEDVLAQVLENFDLTVKEFGDSGRFTDKEMTRLKAIQDLLNAE